MAAMGRGRKGKRKSPEDDAPEVRPADTTESSVIFPAEYHWKEMKTTLVDMTVPEPPSITFKGAKIVWDDIPIKPGTKLTTEQLEKLLGHLQDGVPGYGRDDTELLADIVCELVERRKRDVKMMSSPNSSQFWRNQTPSPSPEQDRKNYDQMRRAMEQLQQYQYTQQLQPPQFNDVRWRGRSAEWVTRHDRDVMELHAPNGDLLYTMSGLEQIRMPADVLKKEMVNIERREMSRWLASKMGPDFNA